MTTWKYDGARGFLTNKLYAGDATGIAYTYTKAGRLLVGLNLTNSAEVGSHLDI